MHLDWWTFALQTVNFLILVWLLQRFLYRPVAAAIARRREEILRALTDADRERAKAAEESRRLADARAEAANERTRLLAEAREQTMREKEGELAEARSEAQRMLAEARARVDAERQAVVHTLRAQSARLGVALAQRLLRDSRLDDSLDPFLGRAISVIERMPAEERASLRRQAAAAGIDVITAAPLGESAEQSCRTRLATVFGDEADLRFAVEPELLAGIELRAPSMVIGDNWRDSLNAAAAEVSGDG